MAAFNIATNESFIILDNSSRMKIYNGIHSNIQHLTSKYYGSLDFVSQTEEKHWAIGLAVIAISLCTLSATLAYFKATKVPLIGKSFKLEPLLLSNFRFFLNAKTILDDGYRQVS